MSSELLCVIFKLKLLTLADRLIGWWLCCTFLNRYFLFVAQPFSFYTLLSQLYITCSSAFVSPYDLFSSVLAAACPVWETSQSSAPAAHRSAGRLGWTCYPSTSLFFIKLILFNCKTLSWTISASKWAQAALPWTPLWRGRGGTPPGTGGYSISLTAWGCSAASDWPERPAGFGHPALDGSWSRAEDKRCEQTSVKGGFVTLWWG